MAKNGGSRPGSGRKKMEYWRVTFGSSPDGSADGEIYVKAGGAADDIRLKVQKMLDDWPIKNLSERYFVLQVFSISIVTL